MRRGPDAARPARCRRASARGVDAKKSAPACAVDRAQLLDGGRPVDVAATPSAPSSSVLAQPLAPACPRWWSCRRPAGLPSGSRPAAVVAKFSSAAWPPISSVSSRCTTPTSAWPGVRLCSTSWPSALFADLARRSRAPPAGPRRPRAARCGSRAASPACWPRSGGPRLAWS